MKPYEVIVAMDGTGLKPTERILVARIAMFADGTEGVCWASVSTLMLATGLGERTVQVLLSDLVKLGALIPVVKPGHSTEYRVDPSKFPPPSRLTPRKRCTPAKTAPPQTTPEPPQPLRTTPAAVAPDLSGTDPNLSFSAERAREPDPLAVAELLALQEQDEPQHGMRPPRDLAAIARALQRGVALDALRRLWDWSGTAPDAEACRKGDWRRWAALLKHPLGEERLQAAERWHKAGRPTARANGPPARASPRPYRVSEDPNFAALIAADPAFQDDTS